MRPRPRNHYAALPSKAPAILTGQRECYLFELMTLLDPFASKPTEDVSRELQSDQLYRLLMCEATEYLR